MNPGRHELHAPEDGDDMDPSNRPNPLGRVALTVGSAVTVLISLVGAALQFGLISQEQADQLTAAGNALPTVLTGVGVVVTLISSLVSGTVASAATARFGKDHVTPTSDPRSARGIPLVEDARYSYPPPRPVPHTYPEHEADDYPTQ